MNLDAVRAVGAKLQYEEAEISQTRIQDLLVEVVVFIRQRKESLAETVTIIIFEGSISKAAVLEAFSANGDNEDVVADAITQVDPYA